MCGVVGIYEFGGGAADRAVLHTMNEVQRHRGPDEGAVLANGPVGLGNRRLAIIDRARGHQPMASPDGAAWITYNGEVFNFPELRRDLEARGRVFRTACDTEVVLSSYLEWGETCVERFNGQFAFAVWDASRRSLFLARDRLGIAPLHYAQTGGRFLFASEAKGILAHPAVRAEADRLAVAETLLCGSTFDGRTLFRGIHSLEPGHTLTVGPDGRIRTRRYWDVPLEPPEGAAPKAADREAERRATAELLPLLEDALRLRLVGEVPWGMMLSGGTDSSTLATLASRMLDEPVRTFTIDFPNRWKGDDVDTRYAELVAGDIGAKHLAFLVDPEEYLRVLERIVWHLERPFNKGAASMYLLYRQMSDYVTVSLSGEGSDELFAGYVGSRGLGLDTVLSAGRIDRFPWAPNWAVAERLLRPEFRAEVRPGELIADRLATSLARAAGSDLLNRALYLYLKHFLLELIEIHDRTSLAFGVEGRLPFLDHRFVERFFPVPSAWKYRDGRTKALFKQAIEGLVPFEVIHRNKTHMPIPRDPATVRSQLEMVRDLVLRPDSRTAAYYEPALVEDLLSRAGAFAGVDMVAVWQITMHLITLELSHRVFGL